MCNCLLFHLQRHVHSMDPEVQLSLWIIACEFKLFFVTNLGYNITAASHVQVKVPSIIAPEVSATHACAFKRLCCMACPLAILDGKLCSIWTCVVRTLHSVMAQTDTVQQTLLIRVEVLMDFMVNTIVNAVTLRVWETIATTMKKNLVCRISPLCISLLEDSGFLHSQTCD